MLYLLTDAFLIYGTSGEISSNIFVLLLHISQPYYVIKRRVTLEVLLKLFPSHAFLVDATKMVAMINFRYKYEHMR